MNQAGVPHCNREFLEAFVPDWATVHSFLELSSEFPASLTLESLVSSHLKKLFWLLLTVRLKVHSYLAIPEAIQSRNTEDLAVRPSFLQ